VYYYLVALARSSAPSLTYKYDSFLEEGALVEVPLKNTYKEAVVVKQVSKPDFNAADIHQVHPFYYTNEQMEIAKFISEYYFSSFSEAISLFLPYPVGCCAPTTPQPLGKKTVGAVGAQHPTGYGKNSEIASENEEK
jgi:primosomal protein N' (replication factor Y)